MKINLVLFALLSSLQGMAQNVLIDATYSANEPSIMFNPNNPSKMVVGANIDLCFTSDDSGNTWTKRDISSTFGVWGDPVIDVDVNGDFYFFHLSNPVNGNWIDRIVCQKSTDNGATWSNGSYTGLNGNLAQDKHWSAIDRSNNNIYLTWTQFDNYGSAAPTDSTQILFSKSVDAGLTWSAPTRINQRAGNCVDMDSTVEGAVPAIGPNGEIYVAWAGPDGIVFDRSLDGGTTWLTNDIIVDPMPTGWDYFVPGIYRSNGLPVTKCDTSGGPNHGTIYINWSDQRNGPDDTEIWLAKSTDGGDTWTAPILVNDDYSGTHQFLTWMDIDQTNGHLYFVFYDRRNSSSTATEVTMAISHDGGNVFANRIISETPFVPNPAIFFGDYNNIVAHNGIVRPVWTRLENQTLSIWTDVTPIDAILSSPVNPIRLESDIHQYPNPANSISYVSFKLHAQEMISLSVRDTQGNKLKQLIDNQPYDYGKHIVPIPISELKLSTGVYYTVLEIGGKTNIQKLVVID